MSQLTIYLDADTIKKVEKSARKGRSSVSNWVKSRILEFFRNEWPRDFTNVIGSLEERELVEPKEIPGEKDTSREKL